MAACYKQNLAAQSQYTNVEKQKKHHELLTIKQLAACMLQLIDYYFGNKLGAKTAQNLGLTSDTKNICKDMERLPREIHKIMRSAQNNEEKRTALIQLIDRLSIPALNNKTETLIRSLRQLINEPLMYDDNEMFSNSLIYSVFSEEEAQHYISQNYLLLLETPALDYLKQIAHRVFTKTHPEKISAAQNIGSAFTELESRNNLNYQNIPQMLTDIITPYSRQGLFRQKKFGAMIQEIQHTILETTP